MIAALRIAYDGWPKSKRAAFLIGIALILCGAGLAGYDRFLHARAQSAAGALARGDGLQVVRWLGRAGQDKAGAARIARLIQRFDTIEDPRIVRFAPEDGFATEWPPRLIPVEADLYAFRLRNREGVGVVQSLPAGRLLVARRLPAAEQGQRLTAAAWMAGLGLLVTGAMTARATGLIGGPPRERSPEPEPDLLRRRRKRRTRGESRPETVDAPVRHRKRRRRSR